MRIFNGMISGQSIHSVEHYLSSWERLSRGFSVISVLSVLPLFFLPQVWLSVRNYLEERFTDKTLLSALYMNSILSASLLGLTLYLYYFFPVGYVYLVTEDFWAEFGTFVSFIIAFCAFTSVLIAHKDARKLGLILIALGAFFVAMEEISWGQRLLGFSTPEYLLEGNVQGEANLHNIGSLHSYSNMIIAVALFIWCFPFYIFDRKFAWFHRWIDRLGIPIVPIHLWPFFIIAILLLSFAMLPKSEEVGELFFGIAIAALSIDLLVTKRQGARISSMSTSVAISLMFAYGVIYSGTLIYFFTPPNNIKNSLNMFAAEELPARGLYKQAEIILEFLDRNPEYLDTETYIAYGRLVMTTGRSSDARTVLASALAKQEQFRHNNPNDPVPIRNVAIVLKLLKRYEQAENVFQEAINVDKARLKVVESLTAEIEVQVSLYTTYLEMENCIMATKQLSNIRALNPPLAVLNHPKLRKLRPRSTCSELQWLL
ncbi:MAG: tetratricopeptide repeat protein [Calditrichaeota bacterium]|nr:tetratricopeptide repeat protein [Calditrichota bacterium]